jgi:hypothetical protein
MGRKQPLVQLRHPLLRLVFLLLPLPFLAVLQLFDLLGLLRCRLE